MIKKLLPLSLLVLTACTSTQHTENTSQVPTPTTKLVEAPTKPKEIPNNVWYFLRENLQLEAPENSQPYIDEIIQENTRIPKLANALLDKSSPYLYYINQAVTERDMPAEIALIPLVESSFDPQALSSSKAAGLWQFIPITAERFKLRDTWWHDERRDVIASTTAALDYLEYLNRFFEGDWLLTMAAYNAGEGTVQRAVKKNRDKGLPVDFWSLDLPKETQRYVPKILAWARIIKNPEAYGVTINTIENEPYFVAIDIGSQIDLNQVAEMAGIEYDLLLALNPSYKRWATDPEPPHKLLVPVENVATLQEALVETPVSERMSWKHYQIKPGDSLSVIARKHGISVQALKLANNLSNSNIRAGKTLVIPVPSNPREYAKND